MPYSETVTPFEIQISNVRKRTNASHWCKVAKMERISLVPLLLFDRFRILPVNWFHPASLQRFVLLAKFPNEIAGVANLQPNFLCGASFVTFRMNSWVT